MSPPLRELDHRSNDGIEVRLLWSALDDRIIVVVSDARTGESFEVDVREGESPLDVFRHPYAYAAWHRTSASGRPTPSAARQLRSTSARR